MQERLHALVDGLVQGVGFRWFTVKHAQHLALRGWVRNLPDRGVELVAEGPRERLEQLLEKVRQGPGGSRVLQVRDTWSQASGEFHSFEVRE